MSNDDKKQALQTSTEADDEPDEWDKRIFSTGCADENMKLTDCYYEKKDWRACKRECPELTEPPSLQMEIFRACWKRNNNNERTSAKDA
ncbi:hypothetical protein SCAR479_13224 [Seiridium cardinale]|uniref:Uncharacterized protein n=1 Tax=Seiridium cardinale TaxID=138064 RepID=A0ABR2X8J8_9PEZI